MSNERHFTTRRGFVGAMGFGALGLYATWAAYGASPLPFSSAAPPAPSGPGGGHDVGHDGPAVADASDGARMTPAEFEKRHAEFVRTHRQADGSVRPAGAAANHDAAATGAPADHGGRSASPTSDHAGHDTNMPMSHADHGAAAPMPMAHDDPAPAAGGAHGGHSGHAAANVVPASTGHAGHGDHAAAPAAPSPAEHADAPIEVYLMAGRFAFEPDDLRLEKGRTYRFHMMATDVAHGASIAFGPASRIVRLRPDTVTTLDLTFREAGRRLVYCTVYCGPGHDAMHASITVA